MGKQKRKRRLVYCPHCQQTVADTTYRNHKLFNPEAFPDETPTAKRQKVQAFDKHEADFSTSLLQETTSDAPVQSNQSQCLTEPESAFLSYSTGTSKSSTTLLEQETESSCSLPEKTAPESPLQCTQPPESSFLSNQGSESSSTLPGFNSSTLSEQTSELGPTLSEQPDLSSERTVLSDSDLDLLAGMHPELNESPESVSDWHLDPNSLPQRLYDGLKFQILLLAILASSGRWSDGQMQMFLGYMCQFLAWLVNCGFLKTVVTDFFPSTVYRLRQMVGLSSDQLFTRKAVCNKPDCCALYDLKDIYSLDWMGRKIPKTCSAPVYKNGQIFGQCGNSLAKVVYSSSGKRFIMPLKTFCQRDITSQIKQMLSRPDIEPLLGKWREQNTDANVRKDVYSGRVWKRMQKALKFFTSNYDFGLTLNIDWFRPHKSTNKSIGAMYMTVLNLPREIRCKLENILLIGVMPSLDYDDGKVTKTEPQNITPFLTGLRDELLVLWERGKKIPTYLCQAGVKMRAALLLIACDSPAARKVSGFLSHSARLGCYRCKHIFPGKVGEKLYGGFNKAAWPPRNISEHREQVKEIREAAAKSANAKKNKESELGFRDSVFLSLPYFNIIRQTIVDPMHNLFSGTAKAFFYMLIERGILTPDKLSELNRRMENIKIPPGSSRWVPRNMKSEYVNFNSYQWKEWTLTYSMIALTGLIDGKYLRVWQSFVLACRLIIQPVVLLTEASNADILFQEFGKGIEKVFGPKSVKPNMHMHCHLYECIDDFGSVYTFWLYPFERYNGNLGDFHTNNCSIEVTLMRKFIDQTYLAAEAQRIFTPEQKMEHSNLLSRFNYSSCTLPPYYEQLQQAPSLPIDKCDLVWRCTDHIQPKLLAKQSTILIESDDLDLIKGMYQSLYPTEDLTSEDILEFAYKVKSVKIGRTELSATFGIPGRSSLIAAHWPDKYGLISSELPPLHVGEISYFLVHQIFLKGKLEEHVLCVVNWKQAFDIEHDFLEPCNIYRNRPVYRNQSSSYMPVQRIHSTCAFSHQKVKGYSNCFVVVANKFHPLITDHL